MLPGKRGTLLGTKYILYQYESIHQKPDVGIYLMTHVVCTVIYMAVADIVQLAGKCCALKQGSASPL